MKATPMHLRRILTTALGPACLALWGCSAATPSEAVTGMRFPSYMKACASTPARMLSANAAATCALAFMRTTNSSPP